MKKLKKMDKMLKILASFLLVFITATVIIYTYNGWQFDTLITCVLGGGGLEAFIMGGIKVANIIKGEDKESEDEAV